MLKFSVKVLEYCNGESYNAKYKFNFIKILQSTKEMVLAASYDARKRENYNVKNVQKN